MALFSCTGSSTTVKEIVITPEPQQPRRWGVSERVVAVVRGQLRRRVWWPCD